LAAGERAIKVEGPALEDEAELLLRGVGVWRAVKELLAHESDLNYHIFSRL
jgi:hypothetical protein